MNSVIVKRRSNNLFGKINQSLKKSRSWLISTPERALEEAYQAALTIKTIEDEHFGGQRVSETTPIYTKTVLDCFWTDIQNNLRLIRIRIAEFKISRSLIKPSNPVFLEKLKFIDEILEKYHKEENFKSRNLTIETQYQPMLNNSSNSSKMKPKLSPTDYIQVEQKQGMGKPGGVLPRSIGRTVQKLKMGLDSNAEEELMSSFRASRKNIKLAINCLMLLILVPLLLQNVSKQFLFYPWIQQYRMAHESTLFLNSEMKEQAIQELQNYEEELRFESLLYKTPPPSAEKVEEEMAKKAEEVAVMFQNKSSEALSNVCADFIGLIAFALVVFFNKTGITALKSMMGSIVYDLSDSAKAFLLILLTDIFVGFHSPHGWEVILEGVANHLGLPANHSFIFLFIATFPVILDTIFKYWIFRYLNQISPSAVATLKNMNE